MRPPDNSQYLLFGGTFMLANKLQLVGDKAVNGLSTKQWFVLRNLIELPTNPPPSITQVAHEMNSTRQNITKMLEALEREGLVILEKSVTDHRSRNVRITPAGIQRTMQMSENASEFLSHLYRNIAPEDLETAGIVLKQMMSNLERIEEELP